jgi:hypothetical protein
MHLIVIRLLLALASILCTSTSIAGETWALSKDGGFYSALKLRAATEGMRKGDHAATVSVRKILQEARTALKHRPQAMEDFKVPGYYGGGQKEHIRMKTLLSQDTMAALSCALAHRIGAGSSKKERDAFGAKAIEILDDWASKNKKYSSGDGPLVLCYNGVGLVFAAQLMWDQPVWPREQKESFANWARTVVRPASRIKGKRNNWACWGILAALAVDHLLQDKAEFRKDVEVLKKLIDRQIEKDGRMPEELKRGDRSLWYTYFALAPLTGACEVVRNSGGPDLFAWRPPSGGTIRDALSYFYEKGCKDSTK